MSVILNIIGIALLLGGLYLVSPNKKDVKKKMILKALVIQVILAFLLLKFPLGRIAVEKISDFVTVVLSYGAKGLGLYLDL
ncbi:na+ dependent nucleoside transporter family protein [[Clostridium] sordellii ATCC 9714]|nr:na+ dependent nucleoside transporter family protein [[Clostridium] sordellii ATCC 9714] [Paeniclostridium sordellii ATCC 9714]